MSENTPGSTLRRGGARGPVLAVLAAAVVTAIVVALWAFQPWKVFTSSTLDEGLPPGAGPSVSAPAASAPSVSAPGASASIEPVAEPAVLADGGFVSQEHETSGVAKVLALPDGSHVLRLEGLASSDGPDLHVWLTDQEAGGGDDKYDDGRYVPLGKLKATNGNQNYLIPAGTDLVGLRSAVIWCDRFNVAFGSAPLSL